jgi:protein SCO1/2
VNDYEAGGKMKVWVVVGLICLLLAACGEPAPDFRGQVVNPPRMAQDFALEDQFGGTFRLQDQRGSPVVLYFGYISCPDVCPTTLGNWKMVEKALGVDADRVRFVMITVDPERDTPERMRVHMNLFSPSFLGLTGTPDELEPIYRAWGIYHEKVYIEGSPAQYSVDHTATTFLIDSDGQLRLTYPYGTPADDIGHDLRLLLK